MAKIIFKAREVPDVDCHAESNFMAEQYYSNYWKKCFNKRKDLISLVVCEGKRVIFKDGDSLMCSVR